MRSSTVTVPVIAFVFGAVLLGMSGPVGAAVTTITGGDSTDGWVASRPNLSLAFAYNLNGTGTQIIQGVTFTNWTAFGSVAPANGAGYSVSASASGAAFFGTPPSYASPTANDTAMVSMMNQIFYNNSNAGVGPLTITISGLTVGTTYLVDAFTYSDGVSTRTNETFNFNSGAAIDTFNELHASYLVEEPVTAVTGGQIVLNVTSPVGGTPPLSGIVLYDYLPEPASMTTLMVTAGLILARRRTR